jgi:hypothetical protein
MKPLIALLLACTAAQAEDPRITRARLAVAELLASSPGSATSPAPSASAQGSVSPAPKFPTTVCRCQGSNHSVCLCLKAGVSCHCSRTVGSVWAVDATGKATHKTGAKADPRTQATTPRPTATIQPVIPKATGRWVLQCDGRQCRWVWVRD